MRTINTILLLSILLTGFVPRLPAQTPSGARKDIYHDGWIDLNKNGRKDVYEDPKADLSARVEDLLSRMNLEEKTCQTATLYGYGRVLQDELPTPEWKKKIWKDGIANIDEHLNGWGAKGSKSVYSTDIRKHVWAMNEVQRFFVEEARLGVEMVKGMQENYQIAATGKHFAVYSNNKGAREGQARTDPQTSPREVENVFLPSFKAAIKEGGLLGVMSSYNDYNGIPITGSHYWLTERLRNDFGFRGYVVSDSAAVEYLYSKHATASDMKDAVREAIEAGLNVKTNFTPPDDFILPLRELVREGKVSMKTLDDRVRDVLRVKFLVGIFDHPYVADPEATARLVNSAEHQQVALRAARESLVLLKNDKNVLPLSKGIKSIAVIGPNADDDTNTRHRYGPNGVRGVTVLEGIKNKLGGAVKVTYAKGCDITDAHWPETEVLPEP